jgi:RNA recognition motif-containing protein
MSTETTAIEETRNEIEQTAETNTNLEEAQRTNGESVNGSHETDLNGTETVETVAEPATNGDKPTTETNGDTKPKAQAKTPAAKTNGAKSDKLEPEHFRKVFVGSLPYSTTEDLLRGYFMKFGELIDCVIMKESKTNKSRGFGFVTYTKSSMVDEMMKGRPHRLDGRELETKRATPREDAGKPGAEASTKKLFVGAIKEGLGEEHLKEYFGKYGKIEDCVIMKDKDSNKSRGFGFVTFDDYDPVDKIVCKCILRCFYLGWVEYSLVEF